MSINSGFKEAPPTRKPSTSFWEASSLQVPPVTDPEMVDHKQSDIFTKEQHTSDICIVDDIWIYCHLENVSKSSEKSSKLFPKSPNVSSLTSCL